MEKPRDLAERTMRFAVATIKLVEQIPRGTTGDILGKQLLRAATSIGANYREARKARSTPDFISKITIVKKKPMKHTIGCNFLARLGLSTNHEQRTSFRKPMNSQLSSRPRGEQQS